MAEATTTFTLKTDPEIVALADRLERLIEIFKDCTIRVMDVRPGDVIVLESSNPFSEHQVTTLLHHARQVWPNNKVALLDRGLHASGVTREVTEPPETPASRAANAAVNRCYASDVELGHW